jgi:transcriptional regulator NrdR family protein
MTKQHAPKTRQDKTNCPHCGHYDSKVVYGRSDPRGYTRHRRCFGCGQQFKTREIALLGLPAARPPG